VGHEKQERGLTRTSRDSKVIKVNLISYFCAQPLAGQQEAGALGPAQITRQAPAGYRREIAFQPVCNFRRIVIF
jgi:hypothetical protein